MPPVKAERKRRGGFPRINTEHLQRCITADLGPGKSDFLTSDMSLEDAYRLSQRKSLLKKFKGVTHRDASQRAIDSFIADNDRCASFELKSKDWFDDYVIGEIKSLLDRWLHDADGCPATLAKLTDLSRCGPGSSVDVDLAAFYTKLFDSTLATANPSLRRLYGAAISGNPAWFQAEEWRESQHGNRMVRGSNLGTVPKEYRIGRTVCTEPPLEMFFQLGIGGFLEYFVLRPLGINLSTQPDKNRELARLGSRFGIYATEDLKSASNSIALGLEPLFPRWFWEWLVRTRSPETRLPNGTWIKLHMLASMGNGYCFPLQTMLFTAVVCAVYRLIGLQPEFGSAHPSRFLGRLYGGHRINAGVFGDDIAVRREAYEMVIRALTTLGFQVNLDKSFSTGDFRESCGEDYFRGVDIRGVYLKKFASRADVYSAINRLTRWSARTGVPMDFTLCYLLSTIGFNPVPPSESDSAGVKVPSSCAGREWYSFPGSRPGAGYGRLYYAERYETEKLRVAYSADEKPGSIRGYRMGFNPDGITVTTLGGYIRGGYISLRGDMDDGMSSSCPEVLLCEVPSWDYAEADHVEGRDARWEAYVEHLMAIAFTRWQPE